MINEKTLAACLAILGLVSLVAAGDPDPSSISVMNLRSIQQGIKRSPERYVAAIVEIVGAPECSEPKGDSCASEVKLVDVLASRGDGFEPGKRLSMSGGGAIGSRRLVFLVPVDGQPGVFAATALSPATAKDRDAFAADLEKAGL